MKKRWSKTVYQSFKSQPSPDIIPTFIPEGGSHRHVHDHRGSESLGGALSDHIRHTRYGQVAHGLHLVHCHVEMLCEGTDMIHGRHLEDTTKSHNRQN